MDRRTREVCSCLCRRNLGKETNSSLSPFFCTSSIQNQLSRYLILIYEIVTERWALNKRLFFLRHCESELDFNMPASQWRLSAKGEQHARRLASSGQFDDVETIITSEEEKAHQTAHPIAKRNSLSIREMPNFN